ncbi:hypothetical protein DFH28DRAFT_930617 [Melampsora americana]|nr:hypothetical protein DFH28DRAFT_930617 [Melampsora americana]
MAMNQKTIGSSNRKRRLQNGPKIRDSTYQRTSDASSNELRTVEFTAEFDANNRSHGTSQVFARKLASGELSCTGTDMSFGCQAAAVVDPTLTTPVQASEPSRVTKVKQLHGSVLSVMCLSSNTPQEFRNGKVVPKKAPAKGHDETHKVGHTLDKGPGPTGADQPAEPATPAPITQEDDLEMDDSFLSEVARKHPNVMVEGSQVDPQITTEVTPDVHNVDDRVEAEEIKADDTSSTNLTNSHHRSVLQKPAAGEGGTQSMQGVEIKRAKAEFEEVCDLYNTLKARVDKLQEKASKGAIDAQLHILMNTLKELNKSMLDAENKLLNVMTSAHPEVIFVQSVFMPATLPTKLEHGKTSDKKKSKRRKSSDESQNGKKKKRKMRAADFAMDEAVECNKETRSDIGVKAKRPRIQSKEFVDDEDMPPKVDGPPEEEVVVATDKSKKQKKKADKEAEEDEDEEVKKKVIIPEMYRKGTKPDLAFLTAHQELANGEPL